MVDFTLVKTENYKKKRGTYHFNLQFIGYLFVILFFFKSDLQKQSPTIKFYLQLAFQTPFAINSEKNLENETLNVFTSLQNTSL